MQQPLLDYERIMYILTNMEDAVCLISMTGNVLYSNEAAQKLLGLKPNGNEILWQAIPFVPENDDLVQLFLDGMAERKKTIRSLVDYVNTRGDRYRLHVSLTCEAKEHSVISIVISDLTSLEKVSSAFARYTSPEIADFVLSTPEGEKQGGTAREVSVLMSDLRGFTALSTKLSPADLVLVVNHYFECMSSVIEHCRGTTIEFLGDGIFVVFGAPVELPNHALAAVSCAIEMQNAMKHVNEWNLEHGYPALEMGIGIHSGIAAVGNIGSDKKMKYGCMGETVNLAGRLESFTVGGQVFISAATRSLIPGALAVAGENSFMPKGAREEMFFYDVTGIGGLMLDRSGEEKTEWTDLSPSREIIVFRLEGKTVTGSGCPAALARITPDEKYGILSLQESLAPLDNLMLRLDDLDAYAKVLSREEDGYRVCFTSVPEGFRQKLMESGEKGK